MLLIVSLILEMPKLKKMFMSQNWGQLKFDDIWLEMEVPRRQYGLPRVAHEGYAVKPRF